MGFVAMRVISKEPNKQMTFRAAIAYLKQIKNLSACGGELALPKQRYIGPWADHALGRKLLRFDESFYKRPRQDGKTRSWRGARDLEMLGAAAPRLASRRAKRFQPRRRHADRP